MCRVRRKRSDALNRRLRRGALLTLLAVGSQSGCTREFYRDWANQDASEAVFEKSRDPRWRLDAFSIEPPAMSRFADPYDPEFPPAPPDDPTSEALSPVPQWPDHRLIVPAEGTGYIDMMEGWMREREAAIAKGEVNFSGYTEPGNGGRNGTPQPFSPPKPPLTPSPFAPGTGSPSSPPAVQGDLPPQPQHRHRRGRRPRGEPRRPRRPAEGRRPERRRGILAGIPGQIPKVRRQYSWRMRAPGKGRPTSHLRGRLRASSRWRPAAPRESRMGRSSGPPGRQPLPRTQRRQPRQARARNGRRCHQAAMGCRRVRSFPWTRRRVKIRCRKRRGGR